MSNPFACGTLDVGKEGAAVTIWACQATCCTGRGSTSLSQQSIAWLMVLTASAVVIGGAPTMDSVIVGHPRGTTRIIVSTKSVSSWKPLDLGVIAIGDAVVSGKIVVEDPTNTWGHDILETSLRVLVNTVCEAVKTKVW